MSFFSRLIHRHSRAPSPAPSTHSHTPSQNEDVGAQAATSTPPAVASPLTPPSTASPSINPLPTSAPTSPPAFPTPTQPTHNRHSSHEIPTINEPMSNAMPTPQPYSGSRPPSIAPPPDEAQAEGSLGMHCAMRLADVVKELAPVPCIGPLVDCLTLVFQAVEKTKVNKEQWKLLQGRCVMVVRIAGAQVANHGGDDYPGLHESAEELRKTITKISESAARWNNMHGLTAFSQFQSISDEIRGYFAQLDDCLRMFSFAVEVAQTQWIDTFTAVQRTELHELGLLKELMVGLDGKFDQMDDKLKKVLEDKSEILKNEKTTTEATYVDAEKLIKIILTVTNLSLPPQILGGRQCIPDAPIPIKTGLTCDIYSASFLGGEKVAKKVFRIGSSEQEKVQKYAERFLRQAKLWETFRSDYTLPFRGVGMESYEGDKHFQLYMVSPLMKNFDAVTYLKQYKTNAGIKQNILRIITDAARGLQYLHSREPPVVHSGMRGDNILIKDSGGAVLGGFGLTKTLQGGTGDGNEKLPPAVMTGKVDSQRWMAPELFEDDMPVLQTPSDVWAWAMTALELVSGKLPYFQQKQAHTLVFQISQGKKPKRKDYVEFDKYAMRPDELWALLEKCWAMPPSERPSIQEVITDLENIKKMPEVM